MYEQAKQNMTERFEDNPCRGIVLGRNEKGHGIQLAWIMGRSPNSQNRVYSQSAFSGIQTEAADPSKVEDPSLIIYNVMGHSVGTLTDTAHIVSNGNQTDTILEYIHEGGNAREDRFIAALKTRYCEPDPPNFTPRISGVFLETGQMWHICHF